VAAASVRACRRPAAPRGSGGAHRRRTGPRWLEQVEGGAFDSERDETGFRPTSVVLSGIPSMADIADCVTAPASTPSIQRPRAGRLRVGMIASGRFGGVLLTGINLRELSVRGGRCRVPGCLPAGAGGRPRR
jgi:hypothetical protein